tara:strand:- start:3421 stop:3561 length:141 start_codon:yes stop_codon:yes gene_type:complete
MTARSKNQGLAILCRCAARALTWVYAPAERPVPRREIGEAGHALTY